MGLLGKLFGLNNSDNKNNKEINDAISLSNSVKQENEEIEEAEATRFKSIYFEKKESGRISDAAYIYRMQKYPLYPIENPLSKSMHQYLGGCFTIGYDIRETEIKYSNRNMLNQNTVIYNAQTLLILQSDKPSIDKIAQIAEYIEHNNDTIGLGPEVEQYSALGLTLINNYLSRILFDFMNANYKLLTNQLEWTRDIVLEISFRNTALGYCYRLAEDIVGKYDGYQPSQAMQRRVYQPKEHSTKDYNLSPYTIEDDTHIKEIIEDAVDWALINYPVTTNSNGNKSHTEFEIIQTERLKEIQGFNVKLSNLTRWLPVESYHRCGISLTMPENNPNKIVWEIFDSDSNIIIGFGWLSDTHLNIVALKKYKGQVTLSIIDEVLSDIESYAIKNHIREIHTFFPDSLQTEILEFLFIRGYHQLDFGRMRDGHYEFLNLDETIEKVKKGGVILTKSFF